MSAANALLGNHSNECRIVVNMKRAKYNFTLDSKITIITGNSFTGKTNFCKAVRSQSSGGIDCNYDIHYIDNIYKLNSLGERDLAVIDLDFVVYEDNGELQKTIQKSKCLILLISRQESLCSISYSVDDIKHVVSSNGVSTLINAYPRNLYLRNNGNINECYIEDKNSGYIFFSHYYSYIESTEGKENFIELFDNPDGKIFIFDRCGFGSQINSFYNLYRNSRLNVLDYDSFEKFLLELLKIDVSYVPLISNKEDFYFRELKKYLISYNKEDSCSCLNGCKNSHCLNCVYRNRILQVNKLIRDSKYYGYI